MSSVIYENSTKQDQKKIYVLNITVKLPRRLISGSKYIDFSVSVKSYPLSENPGAIVNFNAK